MSLPRPIKPGSTYLVTQRCSQRQLWLVPSALTNQIILYCLAVAASKTGVMLHAVCVLSNHWHGVVTDPEGRLPEFSWWFHTYVAKCMNRYLGRSENLWTTEQPNYVELGTDEAVLGAIVYTLSNPTKAGLVARGSDWPGVRTAPRDIRGASLDVERPPVFFRKNGVMPDTETLQWTRPAIFSNLSDDELAALIEQKVEEREASIRKIHAREGRPFLGRRAVLRQRPSDKPRRENSRRKPRPRFAAHCRRIRQEAALAYRAFLDSYRKALALWRAGATDVLFPPGTYALRRFANVAVAPEPGANAKPTAT